ncbi:hypothetical protein GYA93_19520 [Gordonia desulfuricans]|uniref:Uncharacterized protein n=1 Tax=Gordonia desulfuricans TaxID=89051 RepID=A0A7K3LTY8_9ACTN|nr:hypothetical protein [Gordonia desulfuricans]NDK91745.1 hypothetical protein [Gordonia desulfuricans]
MLDDIDRLVDEQLAQESSGYDHNVNQPRCWHCGRDWHGMPLTSRIEYLRMVAAVGYSVDRELAEYRAEEDDSELLCPGSTFIGPRRPTTRDQMKAHALRTSRGTIIDFNITPGSEAVAQYREAWEGWERMTEAVTAARDPIRWAFNQIGDAFRSLEQIIGAPERQPRFRHGAVAIDRDVVLLRDLADDVSVDAADPGPDTPQQRALPRPSTTPPMWTARADGRRRR